MILSGVEIERRLGEDIRIEPFCIGQINPNSYNVTLHNELVVYTEAVLDMKKDNAYKTIAIPPEGFVIEPGRLYLARTAEYTETHNLVPMLEGRSSLGRLGISIHITAGFGDVGFAGYWTLEIYCIHPVRIYAGVEVGQLYYHTIEGEYARYADANNPKSGKYQKNKGIQTSQMYKDFPQR